jgi:DNA polymerase III delta' subunit
MLTLDDILGQPAAIGHIKRAYLEERLPHGLIFAGPVGVGKATTARALAALFLCEKPKDTTACGNCDSCRLLEADNHPDFHVVYRQLIRLEKEASKARDLPVDVVRQFLIAPANHKAAMMKGKVFVVEEAETMNVEAQNAMLKTLEEPIGRTLIILITDQPWQLLPTIRSRCQMIRFCGLEPALVHAELERRGISKSDARDAAAFADGSLGLAIRWLEDGIVNRARELETRLTQVVTGRPTVDLHAWFKEAADQYAEKQLERDPLSSKDQATREGLGVYLRLAAQFFRRRLNAIDDPAELEQHCAGIDAMVRAEQFLDANVNIPLIFQQLAVTLERLFAGASAAAVATTRR